MLVLLEACASFFLAASGIHAIVTILHAGQFLAIPNIVFGRLPSICLVIPFVFWIACSITTCPVLVLQETMALFILASERLHAILAIGSGAEKVAIPYMFPLVDPSFVFPLHLIFARLIATCPMIILFVALTLGILTLLRIHAIFSVFRSRELMAFPDRLIALRLPLVVHPFHIRLTSAIAAGPMLILSPALALVIAATQGLRAILPILAATFPGCPDDVASRKLKRPPRGLATDRQQTCGPNG